jgi:hypothetical protein
MRHGPLNFGMRKKVTPETLRDFMQKLAASAQSPGHVYFTGGATALLLGLREQTIDLDIKFDPEPRGAFEAIAHLKNSLDLNIELAAPSDFIPVTSDWKSHSRFIDRIGDISFSHFDLRAQILSKIERSYEQDIEDARHFQAAGKITAEELLAYFRAVQPLFIRYPAIDAETLESKLSSFFRNQ